MSEHDMSDDTQDAGAETITVTDMWTGAPATRVFHGAGSTLGISSVQHEAGLSVRPVRLSLSALSAPVTDAAQVLRPAWRAGADYGAGRSRPTPACRSACPSPGSRASATRRRSLRPEPGSCQAVLEMEGSSRPRGSWRSRTDGASRTRHRLTRDTDDRFRRYKAIARTIDVPWGEKDGRAAGR